MEFQESKDLNTKNIEIAVRRQMTKVHLQCMLHLYAFMKFRTIITKKVLRYHEAMENSLCGDKT